MPCPKCNGIVEWKDRSWTAAGEDPGHWRCVNCGKVIYQGNVIRPGQTRGVPFLAPVIETIKKMDAEILTANKEICKMLLKEKEEEEMRTDAGKECSRKECKKRGQILPFEEFSKNRANHDGHEYFCKQCKADLAAASRDRIKKEAEGGNGRRKKKRPRNPEPAPVTMAPSITGLDAQLAVDLKQMKRRISKELMQVYRDGGEKAVEEYLA